MNYYSFWTGTPGTSRSQWIKIDLKMPALSVKEAITLDFFRRQYQQKYQKNYTIKKFQFLEPSRDYVYLGYRMVIEYERISRGNQASRHRYKIINEIPTHRILKQFPVDHNGPFKPMLT